jgi:energy-coupling factor transport system permease protein
MIAYRRRASALHAARAGLGCVFCAALMLPALLFDHPLVLLAAGVAVAAAGLAAGVGREIGRAARLAVPLALLTAAINPLVTHEGITVLARLGTVPVLGQVDVTLEATAYGALQGLRVAVVILAAALYTAAVDPDEVLRLFRRLSVRSALTATVANRLVPVLARDAGRIADAQRCRPGPAPSRLALLRAVTANVLDRSVDVAAALEVRGYAGARRLRVARRPWSQVDRAVALAAVTVAAGAIAAKAAGVAAFSPYPRLHAALDVPALAFAVALVLAALAPFLVRRGIR